PIVAVINGGTAREAELVAGALQDNHRAVLLGTKSFGEAAIETTIPLNGNGAIKLTTARFVTPSGRAIQGKGLDPDMTVSPLKLEKVAQADRRREADLRGALKNPDAAAAAAAKGATPSPAPGAAPSGAPGSPPGGATTPGKEPSATTQPAKNDQPSVASGDIGTTSDEQLSEAVDVLRGPALATGPVPRPAAGEVLIRVAAAGVNRPDILQRTGNYPPPPGASPIPGLEVSGTIAALGPDVTEWHEGDPVCALVAGGGYAEHCVAPDPQCLTVPVGLSG